MRKLTTVCCVLALGLGSFPSPAADPDRGTAPKPLLSLHGRKCKVAKGSYRRIESPDAWKALWLEHQTGSAKPDPIPEEVVTGEVDSTRCMVIAVFEGKEGRWEGFAVYSVTETSGQVLVRVSPLSRQTGVGVPPGQCGDGDQYLSGWGVFVLPRTKKTVVIEEDVREYLPDPPVWKKRAEFKAGDGSAKR